MLVMSMHVGVVRLDEELRLRKNLIFEGSWIAESFSWNCSFNWPICGNLVLIVYLAN